MPLAAQNLTTAGGTALGDGDAELEGRVFTARAFVEGRRWRVLSRRQAYYDCSQHDYKQVDFDGRIIPSDYARTGFTQPLLTREKASWYVPLSGRRPSAPYRLGRAITNAFSNFVFGEGRFPTIGVPGDDDSEDFIQTCSRVGQLPMRMVRARNLGGAVGTVGLSWSYVKGKPRYQVHNARDLFVHEWEDREGLIPAAVTECFKSVQEEWDPIHKQVVDVEYWHRRDWSMREELVFLPARVDPDGGEPPWELDLDKCVVHNDQDSHFVWIQNLPSEDVDGLPDCDSQYEALDEIDTMLSVIVRGAKLNLDPTVVLKADPMMVARLGIKKGSDNVIVVDKEGGDAKYMELAGTSIEAGIKIFNEFRKTILEVAECVIPDPDTVAAAAASAAAQKLVYQRMISKGTILQEQYGSGLQRLSEPMLFIAQARVQVPVQLADEDGNVTEHDQSFQLPPRVEDQDVMGDDGQPTGDKTPKVTERHPGQGVDVDLTWPPRFPPTTLDQQQMITAVSTAVGAAPVMSQQTGTELVMTAFGKEGADEWKKVQGDAKQAAQQAQVQAGAFDAGAGGGAGVPPHQKVAPPGGTPKPPGGKPPKLPGGPDADANGSP